MSQRLRHDLHGANHAQIFIYSQMRALPPLANSDFSPCSSLVGGLCARIFLFLAGSAAHLQLARGKTKADLSRSLLTRDLWLTVLEATVINHVWVLVTALPVMQVFWALGISMVMLAGLVRLPLPLMAAVGTIFVAGHNAFDHVRAASVST
jgi:uncharacterized membrane protein